jgi:hypothetical protein
MFLWFFILVIAPTFASKILALLAFAAIYGFWTYQIWGYILILFVYIFQIIVIAITYVYYVLYYNYWYFDKLGSFRVGEGVKVFFMVY